ncbi:MAG: LysR family transcriptional regulator [Pseudomonadota bacterium]
MPRNIDMTALRSFVTVADTGGVTRAAAALNLTQSAVSMQLKRLEENLGQGLLDRTGRGVGLTSAGEQLLSYGRKLLALNDEIYSRMTDDVYEGVIVFGVPSDIVYPSVPPVLRLFHAEHPRMKVQLLSSYTLMLKQMFEAGQCDLILTTEDETPPNCETVGKLPLLWYGARDGDAWQSRPIPLASQPKCQFRRGMLEALDQAGIPWEIAVESDSSRTTEATVAADFAVAAYLKGTAADQMMPVSHNGVLPDLGTRKINLYSSDAAANPTIADLAGLVRRAFQTPQLALTA